MKIEDKETEYLTIRDYIVENFNTKDTRHLVEDLLGNLLDSIEDFKEIEKWIWQEHLN